MRVALINMPWASPAVPSIQCGLLKAELQQHGYPADVLYLNLELAKLLGPDRYDSIMTSRGERSTLLGEWLFGAAAFGQRPDAAEYLATVGVAKDLKLSRAELIDLRDNVLPHWLAEIAAEPRWAQYDVVGFTSTFQQNVAAIGLARLLKDRYPDLVTLFGGANFDGEMGPEYVRAFPWIDYAIIGEADQALPDFIGCLARGQSPAGVPGVCCRGADGGVSGGRPAEPVAELDELPTPDYAEYFQALDRAGRAAVLGQMRPHLLYEASRGCWWGAKHHCTFCGLNALGLTYRHKSPAVVLADLAKLISEYQVLRIDAVDNIMEMSYLRGLLPELAATGWDLQLFFEVKANLTAAQLAVLKRAGVVTIQPGIESLSSHCLELMRKGSSLLINVRLLKWAQYYGIDVSWNILTGFPGETDEDYQRQADLIPSLHHLKPPAECGPIWLERFSPYFFDPSFPIADITVPDAYRFVYPPGLRLEKIAYYFEYRAADLASPAATARLGEAVRTWQSSWAGQSPPVLRYERGADWLRITDTRGGRHREAVLAGWRAGAYEFCGERARTVAALTEHVSGLAGGDRVEERVRQFVDNCLRERLMVAEDEHYFSLAIPVGGPVTG